MAYYSEIDHIKTAFLSKGQPEWEFYRGTNANRRSQDKRYTSLIDESPEGAGLEESFDYLEEVLNRVSYKGGKTNLLIGPKDEKPVFVMPISLSKHTMSQPPDFATGQRGGPRAGTYANVGARFYDEKLQDKIRIYDLERQLEDANAPAGPWAAIGQRLIENIDPNTVLLAITSLLSGITGQKIQIPPLQPSEMQTQRNTGNIAGINNSEEELEDSIENLMGLISQASDNDPDRIKRVLDNVTNMIKSNPAILKQLSQ